MLGAMASVGTWYQSKRSLLRTTIGAARTERNFMATPKGFETVESTGYLRLTHG